MQYNMLLFHSFHFFKDAIRKNNKKKLEKMFGIFFSFFFKLPSSSVHVRTHAHFCYVRKTVPIPQASSIVLGCVCVPLGHSLLLIAILHMG